MPGGPPVPLLVLNVTFVEFEVVVQLNFRAVRMDQQVDAFAHLAHDPDANRHESRIHIAPYRVWPAFEIKAA